jgi:hypothetical protein
MCVCVCVCMLLGVNVLMWNVCKPHDDVDPWVSKLSYCNYVKSGIYGVHPVYERFWNRQVKNTHMVHCWKDEKGMKISEYSVLSTASVLKCEEEQRGWM